MDSIDANLHLLGCHEDITFLLLLHIKCQQVLVVFRYHLSDHLIHDVDWQLLSHYTGSKPFLLSGGIGPEDADKVLSFSHPRFVGIDLNSRFESAPGVKDIQTLKTFIQNIRSHEQN